MKIGFYVLGKKGFIALQKFKDTFGTNSLAFVIGARDNGVEYDWYDEIAELCYTNKIAFRIRGEVNDIALPGADFQFAIGWRWMIKDASNLIVFHDSLLPKYRGFAPLVNMLVEGVDEIGVSVLLATDEYDKGEIVYQLKKRISYPIKISDAIDEIVPLYEDLLVKTVNDIFFAGRLNSFRQDENLASYSLWRDERDYFIDWSMSAEKIKRFVDAVGSPYRGAASYVNDELVRILDGLPLCDVSIVNRVACIGKIITFHDSFPVVVCGSGLFKITDLCTEQGKSLIGKIRFRSRFENKK